jgi:hypothetical protein
MLLESRQKHQRVQPPIEAHFHHAAQPFSMTRKNGIERGFIARSSAFN